VAAPSFLTRVLAIADEPDDDDDVRLRKRMGITAGIVTAARMESSGLPGRIQVAARTHDLLAVGATMGAEAEGLPVDGFEPRTVDVKGLGLMTTYLVARPLPSPVMR
jgi:hypothetical protein